MKTYIFKILLAFSVLILDSCSGDDDQVVDTQKPEIVLNSPGEHQEFMPGEEIYLNADFSDNVELGSYKIEIHYAEDGHTHKGNEEFAEWFYTETGPLEPGSVQTNFQKQIPVPLEINNLPIAEGHYHFGIYLTDKAGNEQQFFSEIVIGEDPH